MPNFMPVFARFTGYEEIVLVHEVSNYHFTKGGLYWVSEIGKEKDVIDKKEKNTHYTIHWHD